MFIAPTSLRTGDEKRAGGKPNRSDHAAFIPT
ncbi:hypothetical protein PIIN_11641 [Serendipita indica DSM 11827]|uniref:Uncharacterized protein n=1 Tax=Serendipita indica (strain DSM 11827) TaxID=1109443 RepID=G4U270_SERID|nr:hypothetical protein PIIN_11641 [Serendipita indica DSM 11827]